MNNRFPKIMGILNVTPDSFSDGGVFNSFDSAFRHGMELISDGADIIDIGGESTRPGAEPVDEKEEIRRVIPVLKAIIKEKPDISISIDTTKLNVAKAATDEGAAIINDISGLRFEPGFMQLAASNNLSLIVMHMQGTPGNMQKNPYYEDVVKEVYAFLEEKIKTAKENGVNSVIADVGIGFGKTLEHNLELLKKHSEFQELGVPMLLGISRKAFLGKVTGISEPADRDMPTALLHALLPGFGADIIRVHNVKYIKYLKQLSEALDK